MQDHVVYDLCIIGHVTEDRVEIAGGAPHVQPGGTAYYAGVAARRLGLSVAVVTCMADSDRADLLADMLKLGIDVRCRSTPETTRFVNIYPVPGRAARRQRVMALASPLEATDVDVDARVYLFGTLTPDDIDPECVDVAARRGGWIAVDLQGLLRGIRSGRVVPARSEKLQAFLAAADVVKAGSAEARLATGAPAGRLAAAALAGSGSREVVVTSGGRGAAVVAGGVFQSIPAVRPKAVVDTTGAGDTFFAAYLVRRLAGEAPAAAASFASAIAAEKISSFGPYCGVGERAAEELLKNDRP